MEWEDVRYFLALARDGSVRAAGARLGVSHSTVARRVEALEERVGARLFDRSRDGYRLTDAGERVLPEAVAMEARLAALHRAVVGADERLEGPVHLTCWDALGLGLLMPALAALGERHPGIELRITAEARLANLTLREADVALRALERGADPPGHLVGRRVAPLAIATYVGAAHVARRDPDVPGSTPRWLGFDDPALEERFVGASSHPTVPVWGRFGSAAVVVEVLLAGLGMGMLPCYVGDAHPGLCRVARPDVRHAGDVWLLSHPDLRATARVHAVRAAVQAAMEELAPLFAGERAVGGAAV